MKKWKFRYRSVLSVFLILFVMFPIDVAFAWDKDVVDLFARLPIQDGGRVKPLNTYAMFTLMQLSGRRTCTNPDGVKTDSIVWLLDCLFQPDTAAKYKVFRVENSEALSAVGMATQKKRDNYSYAELLPVRDKLIELGRQFSEKEDRVRTAIERETVALAINIRVFEKIVAFTDFTRERFDVSASQLLAGLYPGQKELRLSDLLRKGPQIVGLYMDLEKDADANKMELEALTRILQKVEFSSGSASALALFPPPPASDSLEWLTPADLTNVAFSKAPVMMSQVELLTGLESLVESAGDMEVFKQKSGEFSNAIIRIAESRGEYGKIPLEVTYYRLKLFQRALVLYILSFLMVACTWLRPQSRILSLGAFGAVALPTILLMIGIAMRSIIRGRPPVTSAYETILFVCMVAVLVALFMEWANRRGLAISIGSILGVMGMFFANKYEAGYGGDTMPALVAVLDTNFWLALHVTTIAIGYGAGFLASGLAHVFILGQLVGFRRKTPSFYTDLTRMVYGSLCFSFVFICIGTVLGGIWANESWGRFWGWDPKENGALMICLWQLAILHARLDGIIKQHGINIAAVIGSIVIAFCWFGVNMLGVGLHSYGFTSGGYRALVNFYIFETIIVFIGCFVWFRKRNEKLASS